RHLVLRRVSRREARHRASSLARRRLDRRRSRSHRHAFPRREIHGVDRRAARRPPLIRAPLSTTSVLDESADAVRVTGAAWAALLILTSLPYRFAQAIFIDRLLELGGEATHYGNLLGSLARWTMGAFVISRCGRAIYARAFRLATDSGEAPGAIAWRVPL